jgi:hypothetical protein
MNKDLIFYTNGEETSRIPCQTLENLTLGTKTPETQLEVKEMTHEEMLEEAARREAENKALAALDELYKENGDAMVRLAEIEKEEREKLAAGFKQDENGNWYRPTLQELTRNERIDLAEKEIAYIVMGGQDGREYANSIAFILEVLDSLRDKECDFEDSADGVA